MVAVMAFNELSPLMNKPLRLLFRKAESKTFLKREVIFSSDDLADSVYLVKSGGIRCYEYIDGDKRTRSIYFAGDILGYEQLFGRKKYDFYAEVFSEKAVIRVLSYNRFKSILEKDTEFCFSFMWHLERQKIFWFNRFIVKSSELSKGLVIIFLEELAQKTGRQVGLEILIPNLPKHQDIADLLGISRQTVSSTLYRLRERNQVYYDRKRLIIRNRDGKIH
jgi:CRP/FNR family transcriptional regulator